VFRAASTREEEPMSAADDSRDKRGVFGRLWARFGEVAKHLGIVAEEDVREALEHQKKRKRARHPHKKIGEILVETGKIGDAHVEKILAKQKAARSDKKKVKAAAKTKKKAKKAAKKTKKKVKKAKKRLAPATFPRSR